MFNLAPAIPSRRDLDWCWHLRRHGKAGEAIERVLHNIGVMDPSGWAYWQPSTLTDTGSPVEVLFSTNSDALSIITEVDNPAKDPETRLAQVCKIIASLSGQRLPDALRDVIGAAQASSDLQYGARLGLKHDGKNLQTTLYAELPAAASDLFSLMSHAPLGQILDDLGSSARATMLAYDTANGHVTIFCEADRAQRTILPMLCDPARVSPDVLAMCIDGLGDTPAGTALPGDKLGFSYTVGGQLTQPLLGLSFCAKAIFKTDHACERRVRAYGTEKFSSYASLIENLPAAPFGATHHGEIRLLARENAAPVLSFGVAAPWINTD